MLESLKKLDQELLLFLNNKHSPFWDEIMIQVTERFFWLPLYLLLIGFLIWKYKKQGILIILGLALTILISDQISSGILKPLIGRPRPCHESFLIMQMRLIKGCGGAYGFVSSHASNTFALATFLIIILYKRYKWISLFLPWAILVSYSRIYLGVHYPGDIIAGALLGTCIGLINALLFGYYLKVFLLKKKIKAN